MPDETDEHRTVGAHLVVKAALESVLDPDAHDVATVVLDALTAAGWRLHAENRADNPGACLSVVETACGGRRAWATATEITAGTLIDPHWSHRSCRLPCRIILVKRSPRCTRCGAPLEPDTSFDCGTGHWEPCLCPSWKDRALAAEEALAYERFRRGDG